jgi:hypothetical protein
MLSYLKIEGDLKEGLGEIVGKIEADFKEIVVVVGHQSHPLDEVKYL